MTHQHVGEFVAGLRRQFPEKEVIDQKEIDRLELFPIGTQLPELGSFGEVFDQLMRFAVRHFVDALDGQQRERFPDVTFPRPGRDGGDASGHRHRPSGTEAWL